jgi:hypothetical protein
MREHSRLRAFAGKPWFRRIHQHLQKRPVRSYKTEDGGSSPSAPTVYSLVSIEFPAVSLAIGAAESLCGPCPDRVTAELPKDNDFRLARGGGRRIELTSPRQPAGQGIAVASALGEPAPRPWPILTTASTRERCAEWLPPTSLSIPRLRGTGRRIQPRYWAIEGAARTGACRHNARSTNQIAALLASLTEEDRSRVVNAMATIEDAFAETANSRPYLLRSLYPGDLGWVVGSPRGTRGRPLGGRRVPCR